MVSLDETEIKLRTESEWVRVEDSEIHGKGLYAAKAIPADTRVIEYLGEHIDKEESEKRALSLLDEAGRTGGASVCIFTLDEEWDIDGNFPWNTARLMNHSCDPNCEAWIEEDQIFLYALRDIAEGEELFFNYGFEAETYKDHPCRCGTERCVGYIVSEEEWPELEELLKLA